MTSRRNLGLGPSGHGPQIRADQADLLDSLPGIRLPDLTELRAHGVLGTPSPQPGTTRRHLGHGGI